MCVCVRLGAVTVGVCVVLYDHKVCVCVPLHPVTVGVCMALHLGVSVCLCGSMLRRRCVCVCVCVCVWQHWRLSVRRALRAVSNRLAAATRR